MKAVIYARFSSEKQNEASIEGQLRECLEYAQFNGIEVIGNYIDRAQSAKTDHRPEFQHMIKDSYKNMFNTVLVWKLDRFARNRYDSAYYKNLLKKNGVRVISIKESISQGADGILLEAILEGFERSNGHKKTKFENESSLIQWKVKVGTPKGSRLLCCRFIDRSKLVFFRHSVRAVIAIHFIPRRT